MFGDLCEPWPIEWCGDYTGINPLVTGFAVEAASEVLWQKTGRRFGNCPVTIRPCRRNCPGIPGDLLWSDGILSSGGTWGWPYPALVDGAWINLACGFCPGDCSCSSVSEVILPEQVNQVEDVVVDGVSLPVTGYVVYGGNRLVRTDGGEWPRCQDWTKTEGEGTWLIEASFGSPVPTMGRIAAGVLTYEIARLCCGMECGLPPEVVRVARQGVTMEKPTAIELLQEGGLIGLRLPDLFIGTYNPKGLQDRARAYSPDVVRPRRQP